MLRTGLDRERANFAATLAALAEAGTPLEEGLLIAADGCGDVSLKSGARQLAIAVKDGRMPSYDGDVAMRFPPFLRWALWQAEATTGRAQSLNIAANTYDAAATRREVQMQAVVPTAILLLVGGTATLLYGLALFLPVIELLRAIAT